MYFVFFLKWNQRETALYSPKQYERISPNKFIREITQNNYIKYN